MTAFTIADVLVGLSLIAAIWFGWRYCWQPPSIAKSIIKTASVAGLAIAGVALAAPPLLIAALALGAMGDFFLSRSGDRAFLAGLSAFALAHLAYIALLLQVGASVSADLPSLIVVILGGVMAVLLFRTTGKLRWPVVGYVAIIAAMGLLAVGLPAGYAFALLAALLFMLSDTVLGFEYFILPRQSRLRVATPFVIWVTYWVAQALFLVALAPYSLP